MLRYRPPKSNIWGHRLRKMPAALAQKLFDDFLAIAAGEFTYSGGMLTIFNSPPTVLRRFENLLRATSQDGAFYSLTPTQCDQCINAIVEDESILDAPGHFVLMKAITITKWKIDDEMVPTESSFSIQYGQLPCVITLFRFETVEQFHHIQHLLESLGICKLNEKHLKPVK